MVNSDELIKTDNSTSPLEYLYVIDKKGTLYTVDNSGICHSYFIKDKLEHDMYGVGKPVACGGIYK